MKAGHAINEVKKLSLHDCDVVIVSFDVSTVNEYEDFAEWLEQLSTAISRTEAKNVSILAVRKGVKLSQITAEEMGNLGWTRKVEE